MNFNIEEARSSLDDVLMEWDNFTTDMLNIKGRELDEDLFMEVDFAAQLDESLAIVSFEIPHLENDLEELKKNSEANFSPEEQEQIRSFKEEAERVIKNIKPKLPNAEETYSEVA